MAVAVAVAVAVATATATEEEEEEEEEEVVVVVVVVVAPPVSLIAGALGTLYNLPAGPLAGFGAASAGLTLLSIGAQQVLALELSALEADGRGRVVSSPRVITADRVKALIEQGTELPIRPRSTMACPASSSGVPA